MEAPLILLALAALAIPFVLPIVSLIIGIGTRRRIAALEAQLAEQRATIERLLGRLQELTRADHAAAPAAKATPAPESVRTAPEIQQPAPQASSPRPTPAGSAPPFEPKPTAPIPPPKPAPPVLPSKPPVPPIAARPLSAAAAAAATSAETPKGPAPPPAVPPPPSPPRPPSGRPGPPRPSFDWESLVGVKLFSAIAGIALVLAALFFLRYSIEHGWLQPPVRVLIGIVVGIALLALCELKAARKYPVTANALDAAAIAILFSTFYAAHALWDLIPGAVTFVLLAMVTAVAVLLSIRRDSLFIAVLGLLGGFATPALLSTGENRPIPLFAYLLLLNVGLAWVAYRKRWPVLSVLTLVFTTIYQWGWVLRFLAESEPSLAMGIFLVFPVVTFAALALGGRRAGGREPLDPTFERTATMAAALPLLFAAYFATVPAYGARAPLLFGFLLLLDAGLLVIAIARRQPALHAVSAVATLLVMAVWVARSYAADARFVAIGFTSAFVAFFLAAPAIARRFHRPLDDLGRNATIAAPALLFVFAALASLEPAFGRSPFPLFGVLLVLVVACAWRALVSGSGALYYVASFFAVAAQALWSASYLGADRLGAAVAIYGAFGLVALGVPLAARRRGTPLRPEGAAGALLLASLALLLFLSAGPIAPAALWALGILLAILNAALFIESASGRLPLLSQVGSVLSWVILASWWTRAAASVGLLPSLAFVAGLTLVTLGGHAWAYADARRRDGGAGQSAAGFAGGLYLGLIGHLFLFFVAINREWSVPPWPLFGTILLLTLGTSAASLATGAAVLHAAGVLAAAVIVAGWTAVASAMPWTGVGIAASGAVTMLALGWHWPARSRGDVAMASMAAGSVLFAGEATVILSSVAPGPPPAAVLVAAHAINLAVLLLLTWRNRWRGIAIVAAGVASIAVLAWQGARPAAEWQSLLAMATALYAVFVAYALIVGPRAVTTRDPWLAAIVASAMAFFAGRDALEAGGYGSIVGIVPVVEALVMAGLLRMLLRMERPGERDLGRLALVAGTALAFVTVAIPLQLRHQWITIGWAVEGAALAWLYRRVPHRGVLLASTGLLGAVFVRLALNPDVFVYEPRGALRILNWYLYAYTIAAAAMFASAGWLSKTDDAVFPGLPRASRVLPAAAVILLFLLLNIEIADYFATGPEIVFRFGAAVSQDLTYTIGWLVFGMIMLAAGIYLHARVARVAAVTLIAVTTCKCFLYDLGSLGGLYRIASLVGLAISLALVALAIQKYVLARPEEAS